MKVLYLCLTLIFASSALAAEAPRNSAKVDTYDELVHEVRAVRRVSKERVEKAVEQEKVREAWEIGKLIDEHILLNKQRADYGKQVLKRLSADIAISETELYYMLEFARAYPNFRLTGNLPWGHHQALLRVNDAEQRNALAEQASRENWNQIRIRQEVKRLKSKHSNGVTAPSASLALVPIKGQLDTYRIVIATVGPWKGKPALDLGFSNYYNHPSLKLERFKEWDIVTLSKSGRSHLPFGPTDRRAVGSVTYREGAVPADLFTYRGYPFKITDGDTLWVLVDLGFGFATQQHLRLRGIDAPEIESREGKEAKEFLEKLISKSGGTVLVRTSRSDKYDRYLADLWVGETYSSARNDKVSADSTWLAKARYVNQELIRQGLAVRVPD